MTARRIVRSADDQKMKIGAGMHTVDVAAGRTVDRNRRIARRAELIEAVQRLDTTTDPATAEAVMAWVEEEYASRCGGVLVGLFSRCYLGAPYVDHRLDLTGGRILEHFTRDQEPPAAYRSARPLARSAAYLYVEVYDDGVVVPVRSDGRPVL